MTIEDNVRNSASGCWDVDIEIDLSTDSFICEHWEYCGVKTLTNHPHYCSKPHLIDCQTWKFYKKYPAYNKDNVQKREDI